MEPLFKKRRLPHLGVSGQRRVGQLIKERKDLYADSYSLESIRRELMKETGGEISRMQMQLVWYVLEGAGVVPKLKYRMASREMVSMPAEREQALIAAWQENQDRIIKLEKALKGLGLEVPD